MSLYICNDDSFIRVIIFHLVHRLDVENDFFFENPWTGRHDSQSYMSYLSHIWMSHDHVYEPLIHMWDRCDVYMTADDDDEFVDFQKKSTNSITCICLSHIWMSHDHVYEPLIHMWDRCDVYDVYDCGRWRRVRGFSKKIHELYHLYLTHMDKSWSRVWTTHSYVW